MASPADRDLDRLRIAAVESAIDYAIFTLDPLGRITSWNAGARHLMGWEPHEAIGQDTELVFTPEDVRRGAARREMQTALERGRAPNERWHLRRDGSRFFGVGLLMPLRDEDGCIAGFVKVMRDRTPQLYLEQERDRLTHGQAGEVLRLKALADAAHAVVTAPSLAATLKAIADAARGLVGAHQAAVSIRRNERMEQRIDAVSLSDKYARWRAYWEPTDGSGIYALVCESNEPLRMTQAELEAHPRWRGFGAHAGHHPPMRGWLAVPLMAGDARNLGLVQLSDKIEGEFDEADEAIVVQLAQLASAAIEQVQAREALAREKENLELVIEASQAGTWHLDVASGALCWDERAKALFGLAPQADGRVDHATFLRALHPDDRERVDAAVRPLLEPGGPRDFAAEYRSVGLSDGVERWLAANGRCFHVDGRPARLIGTVIDVTGRKRVEQALRDSEQRFRLAVASASLGTWEIDVASGQVRWSDGARRMFGFTGDELVPLSYPVGRIDPEDRPAVEAAIAAALDPGGSGEYRAQYRVRWPDGAVRWLDAVGVAQFEDGPGGVRRAARFAGVIWDVTEQRELIESLREADARKDEFLAMLAHELRNPLAPLTNAHRLLARSAHLDERDRRALAVAERQTAQLKRLVDDLLEVGRITRGKIELRCEPMSANTAVYHAIDSVTPQIERRRQSLDVRMPPRPSRIVADPARVAQVLENLLTNASKYTREDGHIRIELDDRPDEVEIRVIDDGIGIDPPRLPHVFELFTQIESSIDRSQGGLGIGLALVRQLVEMHGGTVTAASEGRGKGATFTVRLPRGGPRAGGSR